MSSVAPVPAAKAARTTPAQLPGRFTTSTTNNGTSAIQTPYTVQPLMKFDVEAARNAGARNAAANVTVVVACCSGAVRRNRGGGSPPPAP
jgi:hypothetical protein